MTGVNSVTRIPALDGIRGVAVALVVASHAVSRYNMGGAVGVAAFYALSGFLIASLLLVEQDGGRIGLRAFYLRRARRLLPALVVLVAVLLVVGAITWRSALPPLLYVQNLAYLAHVDVALPLSHTWSLAIEEQFYLAFPLTLLLLRRLTDRQLLVIYGTAALASAGWRLTMFDRPDWAYYGTDTNACLLLAGVTAALVVRTTAWRPPTWLAAPLVAGMIALGLVPYVPATRVLVPVLSALATAVLITASLEHVRWLTVRPLVHLGQRSYGLYLWHYPILFGWWRVGSPWWALVPCLALAWGLTELSWRYVEKPFLRRPIPAVHSVGVKPATSSA